MEDSDDMEGGHRHKTQTFAQWSEAVRARIDPTEEGEEGREIAALSGSRWQQSDAYATVPSFSLILRAVATTEPETAKMAVVADHEPEKEPKDEPGVVRSFIAAAVVTTVFAIILIAFLAYLSLSN